MPLILAIEPDRRQANQLTAMVRGRLHAELVLADSAERALTALGDRVPDLVLTSALLSPKDETALGDRLRSLDGRAAHVQTLTIPVLATTSSRGGGRGSGVLSALRREKNKAGAPEGCDPAVFAEQCKEYLERAAADQEAFLEQAARVTVKEPVRPVSPSPVTGSEWVVVREEETPAPPVDAAPAPSIEPADEFDSLPVESAARPDDKAPLYTPPQYRTPAGIFTYEETPGPAVDGLHISDKAAATEHSSTEPDLENTPAVAPVQVNDGDLSPRVDRVLREFLDLTSNESDGPASLLAAVAALAAEEQSYVVTSAAEPVVDAPVAEPQVQIEHAAFDRATETVIEPEASPRRERTDAEQDFLDLSSLLQSPTASAATAADPSDDPSVDVYEIDASALGGDRLTTLSDLEDIFRNNPELAPALEPTPAAAPAAVPVNELDKLKEWEDIVEALRRDAERLEARNPAGNDVANAAPIGDALDSPPRELPHIDAPPLVIEPVPSAAAPPRSEPAAPPPRETAAADPNPKRKRKGIKPSPAQDEWGFFDPDQCGFAALIEKLEEINDKDDTPAPRGA